MQTRSYTKVVKVSKIAKIDTDTSYSENIITQILDNQIKQTLKPQQYLVDIDFDKSSREWSANKKRVGQMYSYVCGKMLSSGKRCQNRPGNTLDRCCKKHTDNQFDPDTLVNYFT